MGVKSLKIYTGKFSPYDHFPKEPICTKTCMPILRQGNFLRKNFSFFFFNLKPPPLPLSRKQTNRQKNFMRKYKIIKHLSIYILLQLEQYLRWLHRVCLLCSMFACTPVYCFSRRFFMFSLFQVIKSHQKVMSKVQTIICCGEY